MFDDVCVPFAVCHSFHFKRSMLLLFVISLICPHMQPLSTAHIYTNTQPLHPCLFPQSCRFSTFSRVTNPYQARLDGVLVLGQSGQPVSDIARQRLDVVSAVSCDSAAISSAADVSRPLNKGSNGAHEDALECSSASSASSAGDGEMAVEQETLSATTATPVAAPLRGSGEHSLDILQDTLTWGHICPTCPGEFCGALLCVLLECCSYVCKRNCNFIWCFVAPTLILQASSIHVRYLTFILM